MPPRRGSRAKVNASADNVNSTQPDLNRTPTLLGINRNEQVNKPATFKDFKLIGPPEYKGAADPIEAQTWVTDMEKFFHVSNVSEESKTDYATFFLRGEADVWWETSKSSAGIGIIAWDRFKELFFKNFYPSSVRDRKEIDFLELKQNDLTVSQYAAQFCDLARFVPHQIDTERRKSRRFEVGLIPPIRYRLIDCPKENFSEFVESAKLVEQWNKELKQYKHGKKKGKECGQKITKINASNKQQCEGSNQKNQEPSIKTCKTCNKNHIGECMVRKRICYTCGKEGHFSNKCPTPRRKDCYKCHSTGHNAKSCPKKQRKG